MRLWTINRARRRSVQLPSGKPINNFGANLQASKEEPKTTIDHNLQALLAIGISAALCLVTWIWARRGRGGVFHGTDS